MPVTLTPQDIDPLGDRAKYRQLADRIRHAIETEDLAPDEALPSEGKLAADTGLSKTTVREAMDVLTAEGLVVRKSGAPARVAPRPDVRRNESARYRVEADRIRRGEPAVGSAFALAHHVPFDQVTVDVAVTTETATPNDRRYLQLDAGAKVVRRSMVKYAGGRPVQIQRSTIPLERTRGARAKHLTRSDTQPYPGGVQQELADAGIECVEVLEEVAARMPTEHERRVLRLETVVPVAVVTRVFYAADEHGNGRNERPVEVSRAIASAAENVFVYDTDLREPPVNG